MNVTSKVLGLSALLLIGCASTPTGPLFSPVPASIETATVYVFRQSTPPYARKPDILFNDTVVAELPTNSYFVVQVRPGSYAVRSDWGLLDNLILSRSTMLSAEAGKTYYVEFTGKFGQIATTVTYGAGIATLESNTPPPQIASCSRVHTVSKQLLPH